MPPIPGLMQWHSLIARHARTLQITLSKGLKALDQAVAGKATRLELIPIRNVARQPTHPLARIRQTQSRWFSTARRSLHTVRNAGFSAKGVKYDRSTFPQSNIGTYVRNHSGRAPFASTLRPNLTGGTFGRTAGGYSLGGGARYFSHGPAAPAHVVQNVSQAVRAFLISGHKAQFDGRSPRSGEKRFKAVSTLQDTAGRKMRALPRATPGSWIDFAINPTITALTSLAGVAGYPAAPPHDMHINTEGLIEGLSTDFSRQLRDLAAVRADIVRLASLGDLLITYEGATLRVHFPGCDAETVERLCAELGVTRGLVEQDPAFDSFVGAEIALLFPMAPGPASSCDSAAEFYDEDVYDEKTAYHLRPHIAYDDMFTASRSRSDRYSTASDHSFEDVLDQEDDFMSGYPSTASSEDVSHSPLEYQGLEGIYRFLGELDRANIRR